jgi:hypothetical protein
MKPSMKLRLVRWVHTLVWLFFVACIVGIPLASLQGRHGLAALLIVFVLVEVLVLVLNRWRCPLTGIAARYTDDRQDNFDIYLPLWLARNNKFIFGALFLGGTAFAIAHWLGA